MKKKRRKRKSAARSVGQTALKLARAHTQDLGTTDPDQRRPVEESVQLLAEYLPAQGGTIYWESFDVRRPRQRLIRAIVRSLPSRARLSKIGGLTIVPVMATRTGCATLPSLVSRS